MVPSAVQTGVSNGFRVRAQLSAAKISSRLSLRTLRGAPIKGQLGKVVLLALSTERRGAVLSKLARVFALGRDEGQLRAWRGTPPVRKEVRDVSFTRDA